MSQARTCQNCKHEALPLECEPCASCPSEHDYGAWEAAPRPWEAPAPEPLAGVKLDSGKARWDLLPWAALEQAVAVLTHGARKYPEPDNWRRVPDGPRRYLAATLRHLSAHARGERLDAESGLPHLAHAAVDVLFLLALELEKGGEP